MGALSIDEEVASRCTATIVNVSFVKESESSRRCTRYFILHNYTYQLSWRNNYSSVDCETAA